MLISSSTDAAAALATLFGTIQRESDKELANYSPESIFVNQMTELCRDLNMMDTVIRDPCGLKHNLSTIHDLKLLLEFISSNSELK